MPELVIKLPHTRLLLVMFFANSACRAGAPQTKQGLGFSDQCQVNKQTGKWKKTKPCILSQGRTLLLMVGTLQNNRFPDHIHLYMNTSSPLPVHSSQQPFCSVSRNPAFFDFTCK